MSIHLRWISRGTLLLLLCAVGARLGADINGNVQVGQTLLSSSGINSTALHTQLRGYVEDYYLNVELGLQSAAVLGLTAANMYADRQINKDTKLFVKGFGLDAFSLGDSSSLAYIGIENNDYRILLGKHTFEDLTLYSKGVLGAQLHVKSWPLIVSVGTSNIGVAGLLSYEDKPPLRYSVWMAGLDTAEAYSNISLESSFNLTDDQKLSLRSFTEGNAGYGFARWHWTPTLDLKEGSVQFGVQGSLSGRNMTVLPDDRGIYQFDATYRKPLAPFSYAETYLLWTDQLSNLSQQVSVDQTSTALRLIKGTLSAPELGKAYATYQYQKTQRAPTAQSPFDEDSMLYELGWSHQIFNRPISLAYKNERTVHSLDASLDTRADTYSYASRFPLGLGYLSVNGFWDYLMFNSTQVLSLEAQHNFQYLLPLSEDLGAQFQLTQGRDSTALETQTCTLQLDWYKLWGGQVSLVQTWAQTFVGFTAQSNSSSLSFSYNSYFSLDQVPEGIRTDAGKKRARLLVQVFEDANNNGLPDRGETVFKDVKVLNKKVSGRTDANGQAKLMLPMQDDQELASIFVDVSALPFNFMPRQSEHQDVTLNVGDETLLYFPVQEVKYIRGQIFHDANQNGVMDGEEEGLEGLVLRVDGKRSTFSREAGFFRITSVAPFEHTIQVLAEYLPANAYVTNPEALTVFLSKDVKGIDNLKIGVYLPEKVRRVIEFQ